MSAPATPNDFKSMVPDLSAPACSSLDRWLVGFPTLWAKVYRDYFYGDGLCADVSEIECTTTTTTEEPTETTTTGEGEFEPALNLVFTCNEEDEACPGEYKLTTAYASGGTIISMDAEVGDCFAPSSTATVVAQILGDDGNNYEVTVETILGDCDSGGPTTTPTTTTSTTPECESELTITVTNDGDDYYGWNEVRLCGGECSTAFMTVGVAIFPGESAIYVIDLAAFGCCVDDIDQVVLGGQTGGMPSDNYCAPVTGASVNINYPGVNEPDCPIC